MKEYKNFISLGYFCSVALELERIGLRSTYLLLIGVFLILKVLLML